MPIGGFGVGLYFDEKRVYLAELRKEFGTTQILRSAIEDIPAGATSEELAEAIRRALKKSGIRPGAVNVGLPEQDSMVRYFEIALLPRGERSAAIRFEAQKYVPFEVKNLYCDYLSFPDKNARRMRVLFLAAKRKTTDDALEAVRKAGLKTKAVETYSLAYVRALQAGPTTKGIAAIVDVAPDGIVQILLTQEKLILMTRRSSLPPPPVNAGMKDFDAVLAEVRLSLNYFSKTFKTLKIDQIVLCADLENEYRGLGPAVQQEFGVPVRALNPLSLYSKGVAYSPGLLAAVGMSLWNAQKGSERMNLLSAEKIRPADGAAALPPLEEKELLQRWGIGAALVGVAFVIALHFFMAGQVKNRRASLSPGRKTAYSSMKADQIKEKIAELEKRRDFLDKLLRKRNYLTEKMNELARTVPPDIRVTAFEYGDNETASGDGIMSLRIEGYVTVQESANELSTLNKLVNALTEDKTFMRGLDAVRIGSAQKIVKDGTPTLKFVLDASSREKP
ncbi:MAG TPA: pilus assembly protein PilM [Candidatus Eisenbacteria bacterium]|nr:pilus assembly protein PilM [Candidatus Eisenbacteria bacterium]